MPRSSFGIPDAGGRPVDANYGFTARSVSPAILVRAVRGMIAEVRSKGEPVKDSA